MHNKRLSLARLLSIAAAFLACSAFMATTAHAQKAGDNVVSAGWFHIETFGTSGPLTTTLLDVPINYPLGLPTSFSAPGSGLSTSNADTLGLTFSHFVTDNIAITAVGGIPPEFKIYGHGYLIPPGPAGAHVGPQGTGQQEARRHWLAFADAAVGVLQGGVDEGLLGPLHDDG
ncbi:MAG: hypothetical protein AAB419_13045, partial [Pseudomonadota bacterium]